MQPPTTPRRRLLAPFALAAAIIWGVTFTVVDGATAALPPADLVAWRFGLGTAVLCLLTRAGR
ncbi:MAG: EamA family transporter, partial [Propionibacteriaceae bacterium]